VRTLITYQVTITANDVARGDDRVVLIATRPGDEHVVIVAPLDRRNVMITTHSWTWSETKHVPHRSTPHSLHRERCRSSDT